MSPGTAGGVHGDFDNTRDLDFDTASPRGIRS